MNMNDSPSHDITCVAKYFAKINHPTEPLHDETKAYLNRFFHGDGMIRLCDRIFGKYYYKHDLERRHCWMDLANRKPRGNVAAELFSLIAPGTPFINLLEAVSSPSPSFSRALKCHRIVTSSEQMDYAIDFPLSSLYKHSLRFASDTDGSDFYHLPRSSCPPFMLIPFWIPPLVTRKEQSQNRVMTSLRMKPLPYFLTRMIFYLFMNADTARDVLYTDTDITGNPIVVFFKRLVRDDVEFQKMPFYLNIATAYIQFYASSICKLNPMLELEDSAWSTRDTAAHVLLGYSNFLSSMCFSTVTVECRRGKPLSSLDAANIFATVPLLTELYLVVYRDAANSATNEVNIPSEFSDSLFRTAGDIMDPQLCLFRNCLIALREAMFTLREVTKCRMSAVLNILSLWKTLLNPLWRQGLFPCRGYIVAHIDAFLFIGVDVLSCLSMTNFFQTISADCATTLRECFEALSHDVVSSLFSELRSSSHSLGLKWNTVLNWRQEDGVTLLPSITDSSSGALVSRAYHAIRLKINDDKVQPLTKCELEKCISFISVLFPQSEQCVNNSGLQTSHPGLNSTEKYFYRDRKNHEAVTRLSRSGVTRRSPFLNDILRDEIPILARWVVVLECLLVSIQEAFFCNFIPTCANNHKLWLRTIADNTMCDTHPNKSVVWYCELCDVRYCSDCRPLPVSPKTRRPLQCTVTDGLSNCNLCGCLFDGESLIFSGDSEAYCGSCASRPFVPWSLRWLASYRTVTIMIALFLCVILIRL